MRLIGPPILPAKALVPDNRFKFAIGENVITHCGCHGSLHGTIMSTYIRDGVYKYTIEHPNGMNLGYCEDDLKGIQYA